MTGQRQYSGTNSTGRIHTQRYKRLIEKQSGVTLHQVRSDGYVNMLNRYGTSKDASEHYVYEAEPAVPDETISRFYEGNGLFAKIIDTPAEEAVKHGFSLEGVTDAEIIDFYTEALDELDWEESAMTAVKWTRLFGGAVAVMLINDGRGIDEPLNWKSIKSIDDIRIYDRSVIQPDYESMFSYDPKDPFCRRGSRFGMPEYYHIYSRYGSFTVHDRRCLVFKNGVLPENCTNSVYQMWGMPEYVRLHRAVRDAELAHASGPKMLDKAVQAIYKMKGLASELATEEGEDRVLKRLQVIDMARGMLNSIAIDSEGEDYDFKTFQLAGVADVIDAVCNYLSALTSIPQTILFGRSPAGMNATGESDFENYYNYTERIQKRMLKSNLRYLLSVIFQAGVSTGEISEIPKIKIQFNPLWSASESEQAALNQQKAQTQLTKAQTAQTYITMGALDPSEVRRKLADGDEFDIETVLDDIDEEDLFAGINLEEPDSQEASDSAKSPGGAIAESGNSSPAAPEATKLPQDMANSESYELLQKHNSFDDSIDNEVNHSIIETSYSYDKKGPGAPLGNDNAAKDHQTKATKEQKKAFRECLKGTKTTLGMTIETVNDHACNRMVERKISKEAVKNILETAQIAYPGNTGNRTCYQKNGWRIVVDNDRKEITSVINLED